MRTPLFFFAFVLILGADCKTIVADVVTIPEGLLTYNLPSTTSGTVTSYFSAPLTSDPIYAGTVASVTANSLTISDAPAPWFANQFAAAATPYFVKFLSGAQQGRVLYVTANDSSSLTLDNTDNSSQSVPLNATNFSVAAGDKFELFAGDTLASLLGDNSAANPLILKGGTSLLTSDTVSIYNAPLIRFQSYYFDTNSGFWRLVGSNSNANNTIIYPYSTFAVLRRSGQSATTFTLIGRVPEVTRRVKTVGNNVVIYDSTGYPVDTSLSQLQLGANWSKGTSLLTADTVSVWDEPLIRFDIYYQLPDSTWRKVGAGAVDQSNFVIPAGTAVAILKRGTVIGATSYLQPTMPYSVN